MDERPVLRVRVRSEPTLSHDSLREQLDGSSEWLWRLDLSVNGAGVWVQQNIKVKWRSDAATTNTLCGGIEHRSLEFQRPGYGGQNSISRLNILQSVRWTDLVGSVCEGDPRVQWASVGLSTTSSSIGDCYNRSLSAANGSVWRDEEKTYSYDPSGKAQTLCPGRPTDGV